MRSPEICSRPPCALSWVQTTPARSCACQYHPIAVMHTAGELVEAQAERTDRVTAR
jgi:hypothetical protein